MNTSHLSPVKGSQPLFRSILRAVPLMGLSWVFSIESGAAIANSSSAADPSENNKNVLVIHSYNPEYPWTNAQKEGIDQGFQNEAQNVTVYHEFLDAKRYPNLHHQEAFLDF